MNELVGVGFERFVARVLAFARAAELAAIIGPRMLDALESDVALFVAEPVANGVLSIRGFRAIHAAARQQSGEIGDGKSEKLIRKNVIDARLPVGNVAFQSGIEPSRDFAQKHARLGNRIEKRRVAVAPDFFWQQIEHSRHHAGRRKNLIVAEVGQTRQHVGIVIIEGEIGIIEHRLIGLRLTAKNARAEIP